MDSAPSIPFYAKASLIIIGFFVLVYILYAGQGIIVPLIFAGIFAILLQQPISWMVKKKVNRVLAIAIVLTTAFLIIISFSALLFSQASHFGESLPALINKLQELLNKVVTWWSGYFQIRPEKINEWIENAKSDLLHNSSTFIGSTVTVTGKVLAIMVLIPVYVFMILFYQPLLISFIHKISGKKNNPEIMEILLRARSIIQGYLSGLLIEAAIVAAMTSVGLLIIGIDYAILLGIISAFLNIIPYLGVFIAMVLSITLALVTKESTLSALYVLILYGVVQVIDNNYIVPKIVGAKVKINALVSIIAVIAGGALWGIPGMFLSIPLIAVIKVIFDRIDSLKPFGYLLGDAMPH